MKTSILKKTLTMLLAFAMVFTMMPLFGMGAQTVNADTAVSVPGGTIRTDNPTDANTAFGGKGVNSDAIYQTNNVPVSTLTITLKKDVELQAPIVLEKGSEGKKIVINLNGHSIKGPSGSNGDNASTAKGKDAIQIVSNSFDVEIKGPGTVKGGNGVKYKISGNKYFGAAGGMAVAFANSSWRPTESNGKLTYGLTITGGAAIRGGDGSAITGEEWIYNIQNYGGGTDQSPLSYNNPKFSLSGGNGGAAIGQIGSNVSGGVSGKAYAKIIVDNGTVTGGTGGKIELNTSSMPLLTHYALMHDSKIKAFMDGINQNDRYSSYVANQIKFLPGNGGDGIVIGDGRKYVYVASSGTVEGGASGNFDYGKSKYVNQYDSIGAGNVATAGNGLSVYGDVGLTNVSPSDSNVSSGNASAKNKDSNEMGIYIAGKIKGGSSPDAKAMNEYSGNGGIGIALDGMYGRYDWGVIMVGTGGAVTGGASGKTACGTVGASGDAIRELTTKGTDAHDTRYGSDYHIINGTVKGGKGGDSTGLNPAGAGASGMAFNDYRKGLRIYGNGSVSGGDYGCETEHGQEHNTTKIDAIHIGSTADNTIKVSQSTGKAATVNKVDKLEIKASMTNFDTNPTTSTELSVTGIPQEYKGDVFIMWSATIYETSSSGAGTYDIESVGSNLRSFKLLSNASYGIYDQSNKLGYLAYPTYPTHSNVQLNMNQYTADVATIDRMSEDDKYQTDVFCRVVLADGRWGKSNVMRYQKNKGWDGTGDVPEEESGGSGQEQQEMEEALAVGTDIKNYTEPENITEANNDGSLYSLKTRYNQLSDEQKSKYLCDYDYQSKLTACEKALDAVVDKNDREKTEYINGVLEGCPEAGSITSENFKILEADVKAAMAAYNTMTNEGKTQFDSMYAGNKTKLTNVHNKIKELRAEADAGYCAHTSVEKVSEKASTCHTQGNIEYYRCVACDKYFSDSNHANEITDKESVKTALDSNMHEFGEWVTDSDPTCKSAGVRKRVCRYHIDKYQTEDIPADPNAHSWSSWSTTTQPTCAAPGVKTRTCSTCNKTETQNVNKIAHSWSGWNVKSEATCTQAGSKERECSGCHEKETETIDALGHLWDEGVVTKAATTSSTGIKIFTCTRAGCGATKEVVLPKLPVPEIQDLPKVKVSKPKKAKGKITAKWKKVSKKNQKKIGGIEIQVQGPGLFRTLTAGKKSKSKKIGGLARKTSYSVRVRAYRYDGGVKHVSAWSGWKSAKTK